MKNYLKILIVSISLMLMSFQSCYEELDSHPFSVINNCEEAIYIESSDFTNKGEILTYGFLRNTGWSLKLVNPGESYESALITPSTSCPYRELQILIIKESTMKNCPEQALIENDIYDKRYVLTYGELEQLSFKIEYDGK